MLRRSHRKSRGGCLECKRRHVKCDENRPRCRLCTVSERECSFKSQVQQAGPFTRHASSRSVSPGNTQDDLAASSLDSSPLTPSSSYSHGRPACPPTKGYYSEPDEAINLAHMELLVHAMLSDDMFNLAVGFEKFHRANLALGFETSLKAPYLMHQVLAFAACHLAHVYPDRATFYHHQAVSMQTRAVSIFNATRVEVDQSNCVPILLFSSMLGQHLLADTLAKRDSDRLDGFITHYVQCVEMHRGIYIIATSAWPLLMESELESILSLSKGLTSRQPRGNDCALVIKLIEAAQDLKDDEKNACQIATKYLQVGLDAAQMDDVDAPVSRYQMVCEWTMLVPPKMTELLAAKRPEALIVLAHYAVLLHHGRHLWQVQDAGTYILGIIDQYLGSKWDTWLEYPRMQIGLCSQSVWIDENLPPYD